jgi:glyoxylase-like metal-dependent hydrolase (beta-lactamase superfamily II)
MSRGLARALIALGLAWASTAATQAPPAAAPPPAAPAPPAPADLDAAARASLYLQAPERVTRHVHVLRQAAPHFIDPIGNVVVVEQSDGLVLLDSGGSFGSGQRVVAMIRRISPKPVKAVVISHWHSDHNLGLSAILAAWPHADVIANGATIALMQEGRPPGVPRAPSAQFEAARGQRMQTTAERIRALSARSALGEAERAGWGREVAALPIRLADLHGTYTIIPGHAFSTRLTIPDRVMPVEILFLGRANTAGDTMLWIPRERVLATGDVVVDPVPYMFDVYPSEMLRVLARMRALHPRILIPGHGAPRQPAYLDQLAALVRDVQAQVAPLVRQNVGEDQVVERIDLPAQRARFAGGDPWLGYWFNAYALNPLIKSVYDEAHGNPLGTAPLPAPH